MSLLSARDEQVLTTQLSAITRRVSVLLFTQTIGGSESGRVAKQVLDEIARLSDKVVIVEKNFILDVAERAQYGVDKSPAMVILADDQDTRMRMYGAPTGYEFVGLVEALLLAGTGTVDLQPDTMALLATVEKPLHVQVFSTPT
jgi:alkyl hydroperoxide reductase subunit AhpF